MGETRQAASQTLGRPQGLEAVGPAGASLMRDNRLIDVPPTSATQICTKYRKTTEERVNEFCVGLLEKTARERFVEAITTRYD